MTRRNNSPRTATPLGGVRDHRAAPRKHTPFPAVIDGNPWEVKEGRWPSFIDRSKMHEVGGVMQVPLGNANDERKLRLHEQAHVAWTPQEADKPENTYGVEPRTLGACEDGRIIHLMNQRHKEWRQINEGVNLIPDYLLEKHRADFALLAQKLAWREAGEDPATAPGTKTPFGQLGQKPLTLLGAAQLIASSRGYHEAETFDQLAQEFGLGFITEAVNDMHQRWIGSKKEPEFADTVGYAIELEKYFQELEDQMNEEADEMEEAEMPPMPMQPPVTDDEARWGDMRIEEAPLTERLKGDPAKKVRATDMGAVPRYMHRLVSDQRVFGRRRKQKVFQGTVLIDLSGSMSLTPDEVEEILTRWPAVTIATYSGTDVDGILRIVAKNGRKAHVGWLAPPAGSNNMVDGPALDWLCRQKGPRVWISDGGVTGIGGSTHKLKLDAARKVNRGRIKRIEDVQTLIRGE